MGIKRSSVTGSAKEDFSEDLQLAWTRAHEEDGGGWVWKTVRGDMCVGILYWRNANLKSHADEFSVFIHGSCGLPRGCPLPPCSFSPLGSYGYSSEWDLSLLISCLFLALGSVWQLLVLNSKKDKNPISQSLFVICLRHIFDFITRQTWISQSRSIHVCSEFTFKCLSPSSHS